MKIIAYQRVGPRAQTAESEPLVFVWRWYYHFPTLVLWPLVGVLLLVPKRNHTGQAWLILLPLVLLALVWRMPLRLIAAPADMQQVMGIVILSLAAGWAAVWLVGDWLGKFAGPVRFLLTLGILLAAGGVAYWGHFGIAAADNLAPLAIMYGVSAVSLPTAMVLSALCCRRVYRPGPFMAWLALGCVLAVGTVLFLAMSTVFLVTFTAAMFESGFGARTFLFVLIPVLVASFVMGGLLYLFNLPFMILAFKSPFYRERFRSVYRLDRDSLEEEDGVGESPFAIPISTEPTARPVQVDDVAGPWQFYVDELARTVALDLKPDGTFSQTIITNRGDLTECPGGVWRLDGPRIHLTGYVTARQGTSQECSWSVIDTPAGLAVFGGDEPDSFFRMTPRPVEAAGGIRT